MMILHVSFPMEKLCSSPHDCGCSQGRLLLFCCIHAEAQKFASVNPVQKPFFVTVNSTNILYCCLYHFCTKNKRGKKKGKKVNVFNVFLVPLQSWFPNWVTGLLIYCVSKLNWRTDAWLQCNKNKVPLLNSLTWFFISSIIIFFFFSFSFPTCPCQLSHCSWLLYSQWASKGWSGCRCGSRCTDTSGVFGDPGCSCRNSHSFIKGRNVAPLWPVSLFGLWMRWCRFLTHPKATHSWCTKLLVQIVGWRFHSCSTRSLCLATIPAHSGVFTCC